LLFSSPQVKTDPNSQERLKKFCQEKNGLKLAELDLENRGAGNILGHNQSGLGSLFFASWTNSQLIKQAQEKLQKDPNYQSFLKNYLLKKHSSDQVENVTN
jgi:RecG-like helicase